MFERKSADVPPPNELERLIDLDLWILQIFAGVNLFIRKNLNVRVIPIQVLKSLEMEG